MLLSVILSLVVLVIPQVACASESVHQSSSSKAAHLFKRAAAGWTAPGAIAHTGHHGKRQPDLLDDLKTHSLAEIAGVEPDESGSYANHGQYYYHSSSPKGRRQLLAVAENSIPAAQDVVHRDNVAGSAIGDISGLDSSSSQGQQQQEAKSSEKLQQEAPAKVDSLEQFEYLVGKVEEQTDEDNHMSLHKRGGELPSDLQDLMKHLNLGKRGDDLPIDLQTLVVDLAQLQGGLKRRQPSIANISGKDIPIHKDVAHHDNGVLTSSGSITDLDASSDEQQPIAAPATPQDDTQTPDDTASSGQEEEQQDNTKKGGQQKTNNNSDEEESVQGKLLPKPFLGTQQLNETSVKDDQDQGSSLKPVQGTRQSDTTAGDGDLLSSLKVSERDLLSMLTDAASSGSEKYNTTSVGGSKTDASSKSLTQRDLISMIRDAATYDPDKYGGYHGSSQKSQTGNSTADAQQMVKRQPEDGVPGHVGNTSHPRELLKGLFQVIRKRQGGIAGVISDGARSGAAVGSGTGQAVGGLFGGPSGELSSTASRLGSKVAYTVSGYQYDPEKSHKSKKRQLVAVSGNNVPVMQDMTHHNNVAGSLLGDVSGLDSSSSPASQQAEVKVPTEAETKQQKESTKKAEAKELDEGDKEAPEDENNAPQEDVVEPVGLRLRRHHQKRQQRSQDI